MLATDNGGFPAAIFKLTKLKHLDLSYQAVVRAPPEFKALTELVTLNMCNNPLLEGVGEVGAPPHLHSESSAIISLLKVLKLYIRDVYKVIKLNNELFSSSFCLTVLFLLLMIMNTE